MFGLLAYPAIGIYKSLSSTMSPVGRAILMARVSHDEWMASQLKTSQDETHLVVQAFALKANAK